MYTPLMDLQHPPCDVHRPSIVQIVAMNENMKRLGLASVTFLLYDIILTLPDEMVYIWGARWSFARVAFHANRICGVLGVVMFMTVSFTTRLSDQTSVYDLNASVCTGLMYFYLFESLVGRTVVASVLIVRVWAMYDAKPWLLKTLCLLYFLLIMPCMVLLFIRISSDNIFPNIAPDIITGCRFKPLIFFDLSYITSFVFETAVFGMTVYKTWKISRTPLMRRLMRDGSYYYFFIVATLLSMAASFSYPPANFLVSGSGIFSAAMSSMCCRMILSGLSFHDKAIVVSQPVEMQFILPQLSASTESDAERPEPAFPSFSIRASRRMISPC